MNTRQAIQPSTTPNVLSLAFSPSQERFATGLSDGLRVFRTGNCLPTCQPNLPMDCAASIVEVLDDRYVAFVSKVKVPGAGGPNVAVFWDALLDCELTRFDFHEPVRGLRLSSKWMAVVLEDRTILFQYQEVKRQDLPITVPEHVGSVEETTERSDELLRVPNLVHSIYPTGSNPFALACLSNDLLMLPAQSIGQAQLISLKSGASSNKRVLRAHDSSLRCIALSRDGSYVATTSGKGTLVRVWSTATLDQVAEFRRGMDPSIVYGLAFSPGNRWIACTSDKGTLHIFDMRPSDPAASSRGRDTEQKKHRKTPSYAAHRISGGAAYDKDSLSGFSAGRSSRSPSTVIGPGGTAFQGNVQEYYGLRPPPISASPPGREPGVSAMAVLKATPFAPRAFKDTRSVASAPFYTGDDTQYWQGGPAYSWTTAPNGTRKRVKNSILPLPNNPSGRPPKGLVTFASASKDTNENEGAILYVIGGGSDARWEMFELAPPKPGDETPPPPSGWKLTTCGFRKYLTRQFVD